MDLCKPIFSTCLFETYLEDTKTLNRLSSCKYLHFIRKFGEFILGSICIKICPLFHLGILSFDLPSEFQRCGFV